jgi:hypothetical protein
MKRASSSVRLGLVTEFHNMGVGNARLRDFFQNHIEELDAGFSRYKSVCPTTNKLCIVKFVVRTDVAAHRYISLGCRA